MEIVWNVLSSLFGGIGITALVGLLFALIKKGQFEKWGIKIGETMSAFGRTQLGKKTWEKIEDPVFMSIVSFAQGLKKGADMDDNNGKGIKKIGDNK